MQSDGITNRRTTIRFEYCLNLTNLEWVELFRYLGVLMDTKLKWNNHRQNIATKATRILNLLKRSMSGCSQHVKATTNQALVCLHLEYCALVWDPHTVKNIDMLEKVQKRACRWLTAKCRAVGATIRPVRPWPYRFLEEKKIVSCTSPLARTLVS